VPQELAIYWSDITGQRVHRFISGATEPELLLKGTEVSGLIAHADGGFTVVNSQGLWRWDGGAGFDNCVKAVNGQTCQLNDCIADARGRVISGSQFFNPHEQYELGKLFLFDTDGSTRILDEGLHLSNGLAWSPAGDFLYLADSVARRIYRYAYNLAAGSIGEREVLIQVPEEDGIPDGMTTDSEGFLWSAHWYGGCVVRYDPDGKEERRIHLPAKQISSVAFGGPDLADLYITSAAQAEPGPTPPGYEATGYLGGALYCLRTDVQGRAENISRW
jgi:D-xylonolactonase